MAIPLVVGMLLYLLVQLTNTWFIGNLNEPALLAGVGMGNMLINVLVFVVVILPLLLILIIKFSASPPNPNELKN